MNKFCTILGSLLFLLTNNLAEASLPPLQPHASYRVSFGFRDDNFSWRLAKPISCDSLQNILEQPSSSSSSSSSFSSDNSSSDAEILAFSKTLLSHMTSLVLAAEGKLYICDWIYSRWNADIGWIYDGKYNEKDRFYFLMNPGPYRVKNRAKGSFVADVSGAVGQRFTLFNKRMLVGTLAGYALNAEQICIKNRNSFKCEQPAAIGTGVGSGDFNKYRFSWWGPWVGIDMEYWSDVDWILIGQVEYHFNRNYRKRITSIGVKGLDGHQNSVNGQGINIKIGYQCFFCKEFYWGLDGYYSYWSACTRHDKLSRRVRAVEFFAGYEF